METATDYAIPGFEREFQGGGCHLLARHLPSGAFIWATGGDGGDMPGPDHWMVCAYAAGSEGEETLYDNAGEGELELLQSVLSAELAIYQHEQGLPRECALEQLHRELTADQRRWLSDFVIRWEATEPA